MSLFTSPVLRHSFNHFQNTTQADCLYNRSSDEYLYNSPDADHTSPNMVYSLIKCEFQYSDKLKSSNRITLESKLGTCYNTYSHNNAYNNRMSHISNNPYNNSMSHISQNQTAWAPIANRRRKITSKQKEGAKKLLFTDDDYSDIF